MTKLADNADRLKEYDRWRRLAATLRDQGCDALLSSVSTTTTPVGLAWRPWKESDVLETAEVLKALLTHPTIPRDRAGDLQKLTDALGRVPHQQVLGSKPDHVPVLRAAKAMCALAAAPDSAFSASMMYYLYCIVREIYLAEPPDWSVGGARAAEGTAPNGYVTWQCVRAIVDFQQALNQTAVLFEEVAVVLQQSDALYEAYRTGETAEQTAPTDAMPSAGAAPPPDGGVPGEAAWQGVDAPRLTRSLSTTLQTLRNNIALRLGALRELRADATQAEVETFISLFRAQIRAEIEQHSTDFHAAIANVEAWRDGEATKSLPKKKWRERVRLRRSETAHVTALQTLEDAVWYTQKALDCLTREPSARELRDLAAQFTRAASQFGALLEPVTAHVTRALDGQLAAASSRDSPFAWDPAEMAFAAVAYGETKDWNDERVRRAAEHLLGIMGERGQFPLGRAIRTSQWDYRLHATNADVIRALAWLLRWSSEVEFEPDAAGRMLAYFMDAQVADGSGIYCIRGAEGPQSRRGTCSAVLALSAVNRMLDERINRIVFEHFTVRQHKDLSNSGLRELFYGDYGLTWVSGEGLSHAQAAREQSLASQGRTGDGPASAGDRKDLSLAASGVYRERSIAEVLERMRSHVQGLVPPSRKKPSFSLVLHGPPGTGKTTLAEALAKSCEVPLVQVTPSDILIGGPDAIESQARAVFFALSLLTRVVILFDEFDPVILRRDPDEKSPSVFSFLTPGMLPKLKELHERAETRSVAYFLVTNLVGKLDEAAIRVGRFDEHFGIYPPDRLSRYGRLRQQVQAYDTWLQSEEGQRALRESPLAGRELKPSDERILHVVRATAGGPMTTLGKPGWFTTPSRVVQQGEKSAFSYIYGVDTEFSRPRPEANLSLLAVPVELQGRAERLYTQRKASPADTGAVSRSAPAATPPAAAPADALESHAEREYREWAWVTLWDRTGALPCREQVTDELNEALADWHGQNGVRRH